MMSGEERAERFPRRVVVRERTVVRGPWPHIVAQLGDLADVWACAYARYERAEA